jgi:hypothetical protein
MCITKEDTDFAISVMKKALQNFKKWGIVGNIYYKGCWCHEQNNSQNNSELLVKIF